MPRYSRAELALDQLYDRYVSVCVAQAGLAAGLDLDNHQDGAVPFERAVRLGRVGRDLIGRRRYVRKRRFARHYLSDFPGRIDDRTWRAVPAITPASSGSPLISASTNAF